MSVVRATLVLLLAIAATARPVTHWAEETTAPNPAASHWAPSRSSVSLIRDEFGPGAVIGDKGALFGFDRRANTECNTKTSHECYCATFTDNKVVGHSDKAEWFIFGVTSAPVRKIGVWAGHDFVTGVQVWFYDGTTHFYGQKTGIYGELHMFASERITKMSVWGNGRGRIGGIRVETSRGSLMKWGMTKLPWLDSEEIHMDPGSGLMMNIFGLIRWSDNTLYAIGFDFLQPVVPGSAVLMECVYPSLDTIKVEPKKSLILRTKYENKADFGQKFLFAGDVEVVAKQDWGIAPYIEFENDFSIKSGAPMVHEVSKDEWAWMTGDSMDQFVGSKDEEREYSLKIKVPPHKNYFAEAWLYSDNMEIDFVAVMELTLTTKATYKLQSYGSYNGTSYRKVVVDAYEYDSHKDSN